MSVGKCWSACVACACPCAQKHLLIDPEAHGPAAGHSWPLLAKEVMSAEGRGIKEIAKSTSLPELVAQEGACRMKLLSKVESMSKMQQGFKMQQRSHISRMKKPFPPQGTYNQHTHLGQSFEEVLQMEATLSALQKRKDALRDKEWQAVAVKPIQASGCARSKSITNMQEWFKAYGEPSGLSRWKDWRSNSPFVQSLKARRKEL